ncbi:MAG: HYD1 signature containing ADP-ribosyltransferase family protein [Bacteroidota bacterium]
MSPRDAEQSLGIKRGRGSHYVEYDVNPNEVEILKNPLTGANEYNIKGNVDLTERNPVFKRNN